MSPSNPWLWFSLTLTCFAFSFYYVLSVPTDGSFFAPNSQSTLALVWSLAGLLFHTTGDIYYLRRLNAALERRIEVLEAKQSQSRES